MLLRPMKDSSHSSISLDIITNVVSSCSVYQAPSHQPHIALLAWYSPTLAYFSMLFIRELACSACSPVQPMNNEHAQINQLFKTCAREVAACDSAWCSTFLFTIQFVIRLSEQRWFNWAYFRIHQDGLIGHILEYSAGQLKNQSPA